MALSLRLISNGRPNLPYKHRSTISLTLYYLIHWGVSPTRRHLDTMYITPRLDAAASSGPCHQPDAFLPRFCSHKTFSKGGLMAIATIHFLRRTLIRLWWAFRTRNSTGVKSHHWGLCSLLKVEVLRTTTSAQYEGPGVKETLGPRPGTNAVLM